MSAERGGLIQVWRGESRGLRVSAEATEFLSGFSNIRWLPCGLAEQKPDARGEGGGRAGSPGPWVSPTDPSPACKDRLRQGGPGPWVSPTDPLPACKDRVRLGGPGCGSKGFTRQVFKVNLYKAVILRNEIRDFVRPKDHLCALAA